MLLDCTIVVHSPSFAFRSRKKEISNMYQLVCWTSMLFGIVAGSVSDAIGFKNGVSYKSVKITNSVYVSTC